MRTFLRAAIAASSTCALVACAQPVMSPGGPGLPGRMDAKTRFGLLDTPTTCPTCDAFAAAGQYGDRLADPPQTFEVRVVDAPSGDLGVVTVTFGTDVFEGPPTSVVIVDDATPTIDVTATVSNVGLGTSHVVVFHFDFFSGGSVTFTIDGAPAPLVDLASILLRDRCEVPPFAPDFEDGEETEEDT